MPGPQRVGQVVDRQHQHRAALARPGQDRLGEQRCGGGRRRQPAAVDQHADQDRAAIAGDLLEVRAFARQRLRIGHERFVARHRDQHFGPGSRRAGKMLVQHLDQRQRGLQALRQAIEHQRGDRQRFIVAEPGQPADQPAVRGLRAVLGGQHPAALPFAHRIGTVHRYLAPQRCELGTEVVFIPGPHANEIDVVLCDPGGKAVFVGRAVPARSFGQTADQCLVRVLQRILDGGAHADHHHHQVIAEIGRVSIAGGFADCAVALPELADVAEVREFAGRAGLDELRVFRRAVHQEPLGIGQKGLLCAAHMLGRRQYRCVARRHGLRGERIRDRQTGSGHARGDHARGDQAGREQAGGDRPAEAGGAHAEASSTDSTIGIVFG